VPRPYRAQDRGRGRQTTYPVPMPEEEPDHRFILANERTFLAWIRTALAMLAAGVAVVQLVPDLGPRPVRLAAGLLLAGVSLLLAATSHRRWRQVDQAIRSGSTLPRPWQPALTAVGVSIAVIIAMILLLID
jgi:putative membrane protein